MTRVHLLGVPHDSHSSFIRGAAEAPPAIRAELWSSAYNMWTETGVDLGAGDHGTSVAQTFRSAGVFVDHGDVEFDSSNDPWDLIESAVTDAIRGGEPAICLGGDHAITHPIVRAFRKRYPALGILHFDAHPDIYEDFEGDLRSHASPFARIMEERLADRLVQIGIRTATGHQRQQWARYGVDVIEMRHLTATPAIRFDTPVYVSLDIDALDPGFAPGVSHREPGGMSPRQILDILQTFDGRLVGADIVEYNPRQDSGSMTATVAAKFLREIAGQMVTRLR